MIPPHKHLIELININSFSIGLILKNRKENMRARDISPPAW